MLPPVLPSVCRHAPCPPEMPLACGPFPLEGPGTPTALVALWPPPLLLSWPRGATCPARCGARGATCGGWWREAWTCHWARGRRWVDPFIDSEICSTFGVALFQSACRNQTSCGAGGHGTLRLKKATGYSYGAQPPALQGPRGEVLYKHYKNSAVGQFRA